MFLSLLLLYLIVKTAVFRQEAISILRPCDDVTTLYLNPVSEEALTSLADSLSVGGTKYMLFSIFHKYLPYNLTVNESVEIAAELSFATLTLETIKSFNRILILKFRRPCGQK